MLRRIEQDLRRVTDEARVVNAGLDAVLRAAEAGGFAGATAEALRGEISDRLKRFIANVAASFEVAEAGVVRYRAALESVQQATAAVLEEARGLAPEDPKAGLLRGRAEAERDWLVAEARRLERSLGDAADMVSQPIKVQSGVLKFLDIALVVAAAVLGVVGVFTGGALAMVALGLNAGLFLKSAIQYARGEVPLWEMLLSGAGLLFPSTKGLGFAWLKGPVQAMLRGSGSVLRGIGHGAVVAGRTLISPAVVGRLVKQGVLVLPQVLYGVGTEAFQTIRALPGAVGRHVAAVPRLVSGAGGWVKSTWRAGMVVVGDGFVRTTAHLAADGGGMAARLGAYVVTNAGRAFDLAVSAVLPLNYVEIRQLGYAGAFHVAMEQAGHLTSMGTGAAIRIGAETTPAAVDLHVPVTAAAAREFTAKAPDGFFELVGRGPAEVPLAQPAQAVAGPAAWPPVPGRLGPADATGDARRVSGALAEARPGAGTDLASPPETVLGRWEELNRSTGWQSGESGLLVRTEHTHGAGQAGAVDAADRLPGITGSHLRSLLDGDFQVVEDGTGAVTVRIGEAAGVPAASPLPSAVERLAEGGADVAAGGVHTSLAPTVRADARHAALDMLGADGRAAPAPAPARAPRRTATGPAGTGTEADPATAGLDTAGQARSSASARFTPVGLHESAMQGMTGGQEGLRALPADEAAQRLHDTVGAWPVTPTPTTAAAEGRLSEAAALPAAGLPRPLPDALPAAGLPRTPPDAPPAAPSQAQVALEAEQFAARAERWREFRQTRDLKYGRQFDWYTTGLELDFQEAYTRFRRNDLFGGAHLTDRGPVLKQVRKEFYEDVRAVFESGWRESGSVPAAAWEIWERKLGELRSALPDRLAQASERQRRLAVFDRDFDEVYELEAHALDGELRDEMLAEFRAAERARVGETVDEVWKLTDGRPGWWRGRQIDDALAELHPGLPERLQEQLGLQRCLDQGELECDVAYEAWEADLAVGGPLGGAVVDRVHDEFATDLRAAWKNLPGQQQTTWRQAAFADLTDALPARFRHAEFREHQLARARQALDETYGPFEDDLLRGGVRLGDEARERLADEWTKAVETAVDEYWFSVPGNRYFRGPAMEPPTGMLRPGVSWEEHFAQLTGTLPHRLEHEASLNLVLQRAAADFHQITGRPASPPRPGPPAHRWDVSDEVFQALAEDFRKETVTEYDRIWGPKGRDTEAWSRHEADHENAFDAALQDLRRLPGPPPDAGEPGTEAAASQLALRSVSDEPAPRLDGLDVPQPHPVSAAEQPPRHDATPQAQPAAAQPRPAGHDRLHPQTVVPERPASTAPAHTRLPDRTAIAELGTTRDGSQGLVHIAPVPEDTVTWLQEQVFRKVEGDRGEDAGFREAVRRTLTSRFLSSEWARLFSELGLPVRVPYRGQTYRVAVRLGLSEPRQVSPEIHEMPDGPPVAIQRWAFGVSEIGDTASIGDLRSMSRSHAHTWPLPYLSWLPQMTLGPQFTYTHNQTTTSVAIGATVQPMILLRSRERSWPYEYAMNWQIRATTGLRDAITTVKTADQWRTLRTAPSALTVWFPQHLVDDAAGLATVTDNAPPLRPAPLEILLGRLPLFATESVPRADELFSDVLLSFGRDLKDICESSLEELRHFFGEGALRGHLPLTYSGRHTSPTLFAQDGSVIGMLGLHADLQERTGPDSIVGPATRNSVLESHVLRSVRMTGSAAVANAAGLGLAVTGGFEVGTHRSVTGARPFGLAVTGQIGVHHQITRTLNSGGSARTSHSLRTAAPLLRVRADVAYRVTLVRPDGPEHGPAEGTPLATGARYPLILRVPSAATVLGRPETPRYLPPEVLHLRSLGVSTTPLAVDGTQALFDDLEAWLRDHGFLPPAQDATWYQGLFGRALRIPRLQNVRKLEQIRSRMGLRAALDEMIEGGHTVWFELPTVTGTQRVSLRMTAERRYLESPDGGITHDHHLTGIQTLNYTGSTIPGEERLDRAPWTLTGTAGVSATSPFNGHGKRWQQGLTLEYTNSRQNSTETGSSAGTGHEFYMLSPTADGIQLYTVPVTYRTGMSWSHGPAPEPGEAHGTVSLALPTYRTLTEPSTKAPPVRPQPRTLTETDVNEPPGAVRLPETAFLDRVEGSEAVRRAVNEMLGALSHAAAAEQAAPQTGLTPTGPEETEPPATRPVQTDEQDFAGARSARPAPEGEGTDSGEPDQTGHGAQALASLRRSAANMLEGGIQAMRWTATRTAGVWQWTRRLAVGERASAPESTAQEVVESGLSPPHMAANAFRIFRDSYVVEGVSTPGVLAGTDVTIEVQGFLTDVRSLPRPGVLDYERWIQSVDASAETRGGSRGHAFGVTAAAGYGHSRSNFASSGRYTHRTAATDGSTVNDNSVAFRVTSENDISAYRFSATAAYRVTVRVGRRNVVTGTVAGGPHRENSRIIEMPEALEFLLSENDLINHPEFRLDGMPQPQDPGPRNRLLPPWFVQSGGQIGFGTVVEVHPRAGRSAFHNRILELVEQIAPGVTVPGRSTYLPGVLSRINEHGSSLGLRTLINAGPHGHTAFHFVHRSWMGPMLVEVALRARPAEDLRAARGRSALKNSGMDNVLGHSSGDGSVLPVPGTTRQAHTMSSADELDFSPLLQRNGHRFRPTLSMTRQTDVVEVATSTRERRVWQRSMLDTSEFHLAYSYDVSITATVMDEVLAGAVVQLLSGAASRIGQYSGLTELATEAYRRLPKPLRGTLRDLSTWLSRPTQRANDSVAALSVIRFNGSETPNEATQPRRRVTPALYTGDPTRTPTAKPKETGADVAVPAEVRKALSGRPWLPSRPFAVYEFDAVPQLAEALRAVDPALGGERALPTSLSSEGMFIRLTQLARTGHLTLLPPTATAPYLGQPGATDTSIRMMIYAPQSESDSLDTAIDRVEISTDGSVSQTKLTMNPALTLGYSGPLNSSQADRTGLTVPLGGERASRGQTYAASVPRREMLRFGTAIAGAADGAPSHQVWAVGLLEIRGPRGTRWVAGNAILRTTQAPPQEPLESSSGGKPIPEVPDVERLIEDEEAADLTAFLSAAPTSRTLAALLEEGWQEDGSIVLPESLVPYLGFRRISADGTLEA